MFRRGAEFKKNLIQTLEIPKEVILDIPVVTFIGMEEVILENYKGILEYSETVIRINTSVGILKIDGTNMFLKQITSESISVKGKINGILYLY